MPRHNLSDRDETGSVFTEIGSASNTTLIGSGYGANDFIRAPGGDTATGGNGSLGGSAANTYEFAAGDGAATVNPNGGTSVVKFTGFSEADLAISTDANGDFVATDRSTSDSVTVTGAFAANQDLQVKFDDGATWTKGQLSALASGGTVLDGHGGEDTVVGGGGADTYLFSPQYGSLTVDNRSTANVGAMGQLDLARAWIKPTRCWPVRETTSPSRR